MTDQQRIAHERVKAKLEIATNTLEQIATAKPTNRGAKRNAAATLAFLEYCGQSKPPKKRGGRNKRSPFNQPKPLPPK